MVVMEDDNESCGSRIVATSPRDSRNQRHKLEVYNEVLLRLKGSDEARLPGFCDELWAHFNRLPASVDSLILISSSNLGTRVGNSSFLISFSCFSFVLFGCRSLVVSTRRYALDVNVERAEDVLTHKMLLQLAVDPAKRPAFDIRAVQVLPAVHTEGLQWEEKARTHPPPAFGSSTNLRALSLESNEVQVEDGDAIISTADHMLPGPMHEITFSADDRPKLLSQLTSLLAEIGLNIQEAHAFSTNDGYSIDVFLVEGWPYEETVQLKEEIRKEIQKLENKPQLKLQTSSASEGQASIRARLPLDHVKIPTDGADVWEIDIKQLNFEKIVASGSYGDLYRGTYCSQDVAIKVLKPERVNVDMQREFAQEVFIMRKVRHKNVVQFIGACTKPPTLCIVTEFMSRGSVYDFLHKHRGVFKVPAALRVAIDVSKGMNYLHQNNIIHRDLKAANLLMDENDVVKVADFGVARVKCQSGVMTAETGTYRWMAPEVIEHKPYDHKADVFSFAIVLWELLTGKIPHEYLTPLQAAVGVVQKSLRPTIPKNTNPRLADLLQRCWQQDPSQRPDFSEILEILQDIVKEVECEQDERRRDKSIGGFFSVLRRS